MSACCPPGSEGTPSPPGSFLGAASPSGKVVVIPAAAATTTTAAAAEEGPSSRPAAQIPSMPCYVTGAPLSSPALKRIVLVFTDVFGYEAGNHKLFADVLAARLGVGGDGTAVLVPDLFRGDPIAQPVLNSILPDFVGLLGTLPAFLYRIRFKYTWEVLERDLAEFISPWIQSQLATLKKLAEIGMSCVGFCFGGWVVARSLALDNIPMKCGVGVHPSLLVEKVHWRYEEDVVKSTGKKPILLLPAGNDSKSIKVGGRHVEALAKARKVTESEISVEFPAMKHGWVSRGDGTAPAVAKCQEEAMEAVVEFLERNHA